MSWPEPKPGLVIRYSYLWRAEARQGREEGVKDRPCAIVVVVAQQDGRKRVLALPVTHSQPTDLKYAIELPPATKRRLGLDEERSWIVLSEWNDFLWPGPDLRPLAGRGPESVALGALPPSLFKELKQRFLNLAHAQLAQRVARTEWSESSCELWQSVLEPTRLWIEIIAESPQHRME